MLQQRVGANSDEVNFSRSAINTAWLGFGSFQCLSLIVMLFLMADGKKEKNSTTADKAAKGSKAPSTASKAAKSNSAQSAPLTPMAVNMEKVDLGKISSILSSLTSAMKSTGMFRCTQKKVTAVESQQTVEVTMLLHSASLSHVVTMACFIVTRYRLRILAFLLNQ